MKLLANTIVASVLFLLCIAIVISLLLTPFKYIPNVINWAFREAIE